MNDRAEARSILRESAVIVFVNSIAGGGRARSYLAQIQKLFESAQVHAARAICNDEQRGGTGVIRARCHFAGMALSLCDGWGRNISGVGECGIRGRRALGCPPRRRRK